MAIILAFVVILSAVVIGARERSEWLVISLAVKVLVVIFFRGLMGAILMGKRGY